MEWQGLVSPKEMGLITTLCISSALPFLTRSVMVDEGRVDISFAGPQSLSLICKIV